MKKLYISHMTWVEVAEKVKEDPCVLVPIGATETQNLHNPSGLDYLLAQRVCEETAKRCNAVVIPPIAYGDSNIFAGFPGVLTARQETLEDLYYDVILSLLKSGFRHIVFVNNHTTNDNALENAAHLIREKYDVSIPSIFPAKIAQRVCKAENLIEAPNKFTYRHGSEPGTSLCYYLWPDDVRDDLKKADTTGYGKMGDLQIANAHALSYNGEEIPMHGMLIRDVSIQGGSGEPNGDVELGKKVFDRIVDFTVSFVEDYLKIEPNLG